MGAREPVAFSCAPLHWHTCTLHALSHKGVRWRTCTRRGRTARTRRPWWRPARAATRGAWWLRACLTPTLASSVAAGRALTPLTTWSIFIDLLYVPIRSIRGPGRLLPARAAEVARPPRNPPSRTRPLQGETWSRQGETAPASPQSPPRRLGPTAFGHLRLAGFAPDLDLYGRLCGRATRRNFGGYAGDVAAGAGGRRQRQRIDQGVN